MNHLDERASNNDLWLAVQSDTIRSYLLSNIIHTHTHTLYSSFVIVSRSPRFIKVCEWHLSRETRGGRGEYHRLVLRAVGFISFHNQATNGCNKKKANEAKRIRRRVFYYFFVTLYYTEEDTVFVKNQEWAITIIIFILRRRGRWRWVKQAN